MAKASFSALIDFPTDVVWATVGHFHGIDRWVSSIAESVAEGDGGSTVGSVRKLTLADGRSVSERLLAFDEPTKRLSYDFVGQAPFPVEGFVGTVQLTPVTETGGTFLHWSSTFDADAGARTKFEAVFYNLYAGFVADLRAYLAESG